MKVQNSLEVSRIETDFEENFEKPCILPELLFFFRIVVCSKYSVPDSCMLKKKLRTCFHIYESLFNINKYT